MCRKNHFTSKLILPGGRVEPGENALQCLERELREELGEVTAVAPEYLGTYTDIAHSDDPSIVKTLEMALYTGGIQGEPEPHSEIIELIWFGKESDENDLTPIFIRKILPDLKARGILTW